MLWLVMVTVFAVGILGYHLGADDAAIYVPGIKQAADPALYPFGAQFFASHAHLTLFPNLVGGSARVLHIPVNLAILAWHVAGVFLLLVAAWRLMCACFTGAPARWGGVMLLAATLTVPVAGTALAIADPYVTSRTLSTPATLLAIACYVSGRRKEAALWWVATALIHPQMAVYVVAFFVCSELVARASRVRAAAQPAAVAVASLLPFPFEFRAAEGPAREALLSRTFFFVSQWAWYEWMGVIFPLALLVWFARAPFRGTRPAFRTLARALVPFGVLFTLAALVLGSSTRLENFTRLQPMRALHLIYVIFFLLLGGLLGEYILRRRNWRWLALFLPLGAGMFLVQSAAYPASPHFEFPGMAEGNSWRAAFRWIRDHTPKDAVFALDPNYMKRPGEDMQGFRAVAERSVLADAVKDSGAVSLFPALAPEWKAEVDSTQGWDSFQLADFRRLAARYPVTWVVTANPGRAGLDCPYRNLEVAVCRVPVLTAR
ncbi:MAG: hypothetical protein JST11_28895 [Acidobacteria bacterium]|nr:hypothetical protein [Acidobacteriota bacterium]